MIHSGNRCSKCLDQPGRGDRGCFSSFSDCSLRATCCLYNVSLSLSLSHSLSIYIYLSFYKDILSSRPRIYSPVVALTRRPTQVQPLESFPNSALLFYRSLCAAMCYIALGMTGAVAIYIQLLWVDFGPVFGRSLSRDLSRRVRLAKY